MYKIIFECDLFGSHTAPITDLCEVDDIYISDQLTALKFIQECTSCITRESEVCPWLAHNRDIFTENRPIEEPFSKVKDKNVHLVANKDDFKTLT